MLSYLEILSDVTNVKCYTSVWVCLNVKIKHDSFVVATISEFNLLFLFHTHQTSGWSALFFAAKDGHLEISRTLLNAGADPMLKDKVCIHMWIDYTRDYEFTYIASY